MAPLTSAVANVNPDAHRVVVYYQTQYYQSENATTPWGNYVSPLPLTPYISHLILAAFHINTNLPITIALNDNAPDDPMFTQMWEEIATMQKSGVKVLGMLGGSAPGSYPALGPTTFQQYYPLLSAVIKKAGLDGLDLDVEEDTSLDVIVNLMTNLKQDFGSNFLITFAPVASALTEGANLSGFDYSQLEAQYGDLVSWYNVQFYSGFGTMESDSGYIQIVDYGLDPTRVVAGTLTNPSNGFGYVTVDDVLASIGQLVGIYGDNFGGVGGWEYFNSLPGGMTTTPWKWAMLMQMALMGQNVTTSSVAARDFYLDSRHIQSY